MEKKKNIYVFIGAAIVIIPFIASVIAFFVYNNAHKPEYKLTEYMNLINSKDYEKMYELTDPGTKQKISEDDFISRNKNIYEGIGASNVTVNVKNVKKNGNETIIDYDTDMNTLSGNLEFSNSITLEKELGKDYTVKWDSKVIFPNLNNEDKIRVKTLKSKRGDILDRNGVKLATDSSSCNVGIVPGKLSGDKETSINQISKLLNVSTDYINTQLSASYVKPDMFIPIKTIPY